MYLGLCDAQALEKLRVLDRQLDDLKRGAATNSARWQRMAWRSRQEKRTSLISLICLSRPPTMSYVESGTFSTIMRLTSGSTLFGRICMYAQWPNPASEASAKPHTSRARDLWA